MPCRPSCNGRRAQPQLELNEAAAGAARRARRTCAGVLAASAALRQRRAALARHARREIPLPEELREACIRTARSRHSTNSRPRAPRRREAQGVLLERVGAMEALVAERRAAHAAARRRATRRTDAAPEGCDRDLRRGRIRQEVALFATIDVDEELVSAGHATSPKCGASSTRAERSGKRLDFLMQELNREANTLGSKSVDMEITQAVDGAQGTDRADARAGAESSRMRAARPFHRHRPFRRRQDQPGEPRCSSDDPRVRLSVSYTTRAPRPGEIDGRDYHFVSPRRFEAHARTRRVPGKRGGPRQLYGTSQPWIEATHARAGTRYPAGNRLAGRAAGAAVDPDAVGIFILPPSLEVLAQAAVAARGRTAPEVIERRLQAAREEISHVPRFDYVIINNDFE